MELKHFSETISKFNVINPQIIDITKKIVVIIGCPGLSNRLDVVVTWNDVQTIYKELFEDFVGNFSEMKVRLDEAKREEDEFKKLSPEEKKQRIAEWRAKRIAEVERLKQEEKKQN